MNLKERLALALKRSNKSQTQVAAEIGITPSALNQQLKGDSKSLKAFTAVGFAAATGVATEWLVTGQGDMRPTGRTYDTLEGYSVPLLANAASMGAGQIAEDNDVVKSSLVLSTKFVADRIHPTRPEALRFIHAYGDSMEPTFSSGDVLLVDAGIREVNVDGVYVLRAHDRLFIKRVRQRIDGHFEISSDNPTVKTVDVLNGGESVEILGKVVWRWAGKNV